MRYASFLVFLFISGPTFAASGPFISLKNTNFIVLLAFILFIGVLLYYKVPKLIGGMLDKRADNIRAEIEEARKLREEAQSILAGYERRQKQVQDQAHRIVETARKEAKAEALKSREALEVNISRRLSAAQEKIASAQAGAEREVREKAIKVALLAAGSVISKQMTATTANRLIDSAITEVEGKLN